MPTIALETLLDAPIDQVFDISRDVELHTETMGHDERAIAGTTSGHITEGDVVTWRATHFFVPMELTVRITAVEAPTYFRDEQIDGPFKSLVHHHYFERVAETRTRMRDEFTFKSPFGPLGQLIDSVVLERYMRKLLQRRNSELQSVVTREGE